MRILLQRVTSAQVSVAGETVGEIGPGLLLLTGFGKVDDGDIDDPIDRACEMRSVELWPGLLVGFEPAVSGLDPERVERGAYRWRLREEFHKLSPASVRDRFFNMKLDLTPRELTFFTEVDFATHVALVAELESGPTPRPAAVGRFVRRQEQPDQSEFAITVADDLQGRGIGRLMLGKLIECARDLGVRQLVASVLPHNARMIHLLQTTGLPLESAVEDGTLTFTLDLGPRIESRAG